MNFKEKFQNIVKKTAEFVGKHPILTVVVVSGASATVASVVAYKIGENNGYDIGETDAFNRATTQILVKNHHVCFDDSSFISPDRASTALDKICRGAERMNLGLGEAVFTMKTGPDEMQTCVIISDPDTAYQMLCDTKNDLELNGTYDEL